MGHPSVLFMEQPSVLFMGQPSREPSVAFMGQPSVLFMGHRKAAQTVQTQIRHRINFNVLLKFEGK